jgi:hypothetical protein
MYHHTMNHGCDEKEIMFNIRTATLIASFCGLTACNSNVGGFKNLSVELGTQAEGVDTATLQFSNFNVNLHPMNKIVCDPFGGEGTVNPEKGIMATLFYVGAGGTQLHSAQEYVDKATRSRQRLFFTDINVPTRMFSEGFSSQTSQIINDDSGNKLIEWFGIKFETGLRLTPDMSEGDYELASLGDDGVVVKAKINGIWQTIVGNDGNHPTRMGCSSTLIRMNRDTLLPLEVTYYQGPRYHISNVLMWKKSDASQVGKDASCGQSGNSLFFDPNNGSAELPAYKNLLARGWSPIGADSYFIPMEGSYNPCVTGQNPVISGFVNGEVFTTMVSLAWTTDIIATTQVLITNVATGEQVMTVTDNALTTSHSAMIRGLTPGTAYTLQAVSVSESLGKAISSPINIVTPTDP